MAIIKTPQFGNVAFDENDIFEFVCGLPGFDQARRFICIEQPTLRPIVFLQSVDDPALCFITLPAHSIDPEYVPNLAGEDMEALGLACVPHSLACLAIVLMLEDGKATANLLAPVVLSRETMRGVQAVRPDNIYSAVHCLKLMDGWQASGGSARNVPGEMPC